MHEVRSARDRQKFPKSRRLLRRSEFRTVFRQNHRISDQYFQVLVRFIDNNSPAKLGLVVSRRVSRLAVTRNRIKRRVREDFRLQHKLQGCELVVIANKSSASASNGVLRASLNDHFQTVTELCENL